MPTEQPVDQVVDWRTKRRRHPDLHPTDAARRHSLAKLLRQRRESLGWSVRRLGEELGIRGNTANVAELTDNWQVLKLQRHCDGLGTRLLVLPRTVTDAFDGNWRVAWMFPDDPPRSWAYDRAQFMVELIHLRVRAKLRQSDVGAAVGLSMRGITSFEKRDSAWIVTMQRYARGCGDELMLGLEDLETGEQWHA